jgi:putative addiction module component (TIGR02574 family)
MAISSEKLAEEIKSLPDVEKLRLVDAILTELDKPDPEIDQIWAEEARKRWEGYKSGQIPSLSYHEVMDKFRHL